MGTREKRAAVALGVLALIYTLPILLAGRPIVDDIARIRTGIPGWLGAGRPLADWLMAALNFGLPIADLSPLPQLIGIGAVTFAAWLLFRALDRRDLPLPVSVVAAAMLLLNPFTIECLSYKFDALAMGLSILLAIVVALPMRLPFWHAVGAGGLAMLALLNLYQVSASLVPAIALVVVLAGSARGERPGLAARHMLRVFASFAAGLLVYWPLTRLMPISGYGQRMSQFLAPEALPLGVIRNLLRSMQTVLDGFTATQLLLLGALLLLAWAYALVLALRALRSHGKLPVRIGIAALYAGSPLLLVLCWLGLSNLFTSEFIPSRMLLGVGATWVFIVYFAALAVTGALRGRSRLATFAGVSVVAVPLMLTIAIAYAAGTAQSAQDRFERMIVRQAIDALDREGIAPGATLAVVRTIPYALDARMQMRAFPVVRQLVPRLLDRNWSWSAQFFTYSGFTARWPGTEDYDAAREAAANLAPFFANRYFTLTRTDGAVVMRFRR